MLIWIILNFPPDLQYKQKAIPPGATIPGPSKPKVMDSFLYPSLYHIAALRREGLPIWDSLTNSRYITNLFVQFSTADGPGMCHLNGLVGHCGKIGYRLHCPLPS
jgi:Transposase family tnp2